MATSRVRRSKQMGRFPRILRFPHPKGVPLPERRETSIALDDEAHFVLVVNGVQVARSLKQCLPGVAYRVNIAGERLEVTEA